MISMCRTVICFFLYIVVHGVCEIKQERGDVHWSVETGDAGQNAEPTPKNRRRSPAAQKHPAC
jgi:hypothetical protein